MALTLFKEVKAIHRICVKGENGLPLQATCFPVDERRATSSATASFRARLSRYPSSVTEEILERT